jgi:hypothetical protein
MHPSAEYFMAESPLAGRHILHQQLRSGLKQSLYQQQQQQQQQHSFQSTAGNNENSQMNHNPTAAPTTSIVGFDVNTALAADQNENTGRNDLPSKFFTMETGSKFRNPDQTADLLEANNFEAIQSPFSPSSAVDQFGGAEQLSFSSNRNAAASPTLSPVVKLSPDRKRLLEYEAELQRNEQSIHRLQTDIETVQTEFNACKRQLQQQISANAALQQSHSEVWNLQSIRSADLSNVD